MSLKGEPSLYALTRGFSRYPLGGPIRTTLAALAFATASMSLALVLRWRYIGLALLAAATVFYLAVPSAHRRKTAARAMITGGLLALIVSGLGVAWAARETGISLTGAFVALVPGMLVVVIGTEELKTLRWRAQHVATAVVAFSLSILLGAFLLTLSGRSSAAIVVIALTGCLAWWYLARPQSALRIPAIGPFVAGVAHLATGIQAGEPARMIGGTVLLLVAGRGGARRFLGL